MNQRSLWTEIAVKGLLPIPIGSNSGTLEKCFRLLVTSVEWPFRHLLGRYKDFVLPCSMQWSSPLCSTLQAVEHTFRKAVENFLAENGQKRSLERDRRALAMLDSFIGHLPLRRVHLDTLTPHIRSRLANGISAGTINRDLAVVVRILNLASRLWRDETDRPWLPIAPLIPMQHHPQRRTPYPLSIAEAGIRRAAIDSAQASTISSGNDDLFFVVAGFHGGCWGSCNGPLTDAGRLPLAATQTSTSRGS